MNDIERFLSAPYHLQDGIFVVSETRGGDYWDDKSISPGEEDFSYLLGNFRFQRGVELGAGSGRCTRAFAARCNKFIAQEPGHRALRYMVEERGIRGVVRVESQGVELPFKDESFDFAASITVVEHIPNKEYEKWLSEVFRILEPGGFFLIQNDAFVYRVLEKLHWYPKEPDPTHINMITPRALRKALHKAGFEIVREAHMPFYRLFGRRVPLDDILGTKGTLLCKKPG